MSVWFGFFQCLFVGVLLLPVCGLVSGWFDWVWVFVVGLFVGLGFFVCVWYCVLVFLFCLVLCFGVLVLFVCFSILFSLISVFGGTHSLRISPNTVRKINKAADKYSIA